MNIQSILDDALYYSIGMLYVGVIAFALGFIIGYFL
jgi:hypothetical protein